MSASLWGRRGDHHGKRVREPGLLRPRASTPGQLGAHQRPVALAATAPAMLFTQSPSWLRSVAFAMILVQAGDAVIGAGLHDRLRLSGPPSALANVIALIAYTR